MAKDLYNHDINEFWKTVRKTSLCSNIQANSIDGGIIGENTLWNFDNYRTILNSNECDEELKSSILSKVDSIQ